ncbi:hypothetical protein WJX81_008295 [Elliptochloris bilobata]|uniref:Uncharacterized protein n=1 Tax=Elliptochloris bilobata TaxID=381761 RepID=A0AAW1R1E3_9CHLO
MRDRALPSNTSLPVQGVRARLATPQWDLARAPGHALRGASAASRTVPAVPERQQRSIHEDASSPEIVARARHPVSPPSTTVDAHVAPLAKLYEAASARLQRPAELIVSSAGTPPAEAAGAGAAGMPSREASLPTGASHAASEAATLFEQGFGSPVAVEPENSGAGQLVPVHIQQSSAGNIFQSSRFSGTAGWTAIGVPPAAAAHTAHAAAAHAAHAAPAPTAQAAAVPAAVSFSLADAPRQHPPARATPCLGFDMEEDAAPARRRARQAGSATGARAHNGRFGAGSAPGFESTVPKRPGPRAGRQQRRGSGGGAWHLGRRESPQDQAALASLWHALRSGW